MYITLPENSKVSTRGLYDVLKTRYPSENIKLTQNKRSIFLKIDKSYGVHILVSHEFIKVNHDVQGCMIVFLPQVFWIMMMPRAKGLQENVVNEIKSILEAHAYQLG